MVGEASSNHDFVLHIKFRVFRASQLSIFFFISTFIGFGRCQVSLGGCPTWGQQKIPLGFKTEGIHSIDKEPH